MNEVIQEMNIFELKEVMRIEEESFVKKWSMNDFLYELIVNEKAKYFVYKMNNKIIAYIGEWYLEDEIHIANLAVDSNYREKGIATKLIKETMERANFLNINMISLEVRLSNINAINLYEKIGFKKTDILENYYEIEDGVRMVYKITGGINGKQ